MAVAAIRPEDAAKTKEGIFPDAVMDCWNMLVAKHFDGSSAVIKQDSAVRALMAAMQCERTLVFAEKWLDIEPVFEAAGWKVRYDKPAWNEGGEAIFYFSKR